MDLEACKIRINQGKGSKDRYVLFGKGFATALRTHIAAHPNNRWLFQTRRNGKFTHPTGPADRVEVRRGGGRQGHAAHVPAPGDHLADPALGLADAELQLITGHARRETLAIYQHVALDGELEAEVPGDDEAGGTLSTEADTPEPCAEQDISTSDWEVQRCIP